MSLVTSGFSLDSTLTSGGGTFVLAGTAVLEEVEIAVTVDTPEIVATIDTTEIVAEIDNG